MFWKQMLFTKLLLIANFLYICTPKNDTEC